VRLWWQGQHGSNTWSLACRCSAEYLVTTLWMTTCGERLVGPTNIPAIKEPADLVRSDGKQSDGWHRSLGKPANAWYGMWRSHTPWLSLNSPPNPHPLVVLQRMQWIGKSWSFSHWLAHTPLFHSHSTFGPANSKGTEAVNTSTSLSVAWKRKAMWIAVCLNITAEPLNRMLLSYLKIKSLSNMHLILLEQNCKDRQT